MQCEQPSAPGSPPYSTAGGKVGALGKKKATRLQSLNAVSQQAPRGWGGGGQNDGRRRKDTSSVYMLRVPPASERGAGEAAFSLETRVAAAARGRVGSPRAPREHGRQRGRAGWALRRTPRRPGRVTRPPGVPPWGCAPAAPWMFPHWQGSGGPPKNTPTPHAPQPGAPCLGAGPAALTSPGSARARALAARRRLLHGG